MNVSYSPAAVADLDAISVYIAADEPAAAVHVVSRILQSIAMLEHFPMLGREGRVPGTRELTIARLPYFAVYHVIGEGEIEVIAVIHTRQKFPDI